MSILKRFWKRVTGQGGSSTSERYLDVNEIGIPRLDNGTDQRFFPSERSAPVYPPQQFEIGDMAEYTPTGEPVKVIGAEFNKDTREWDYEVQNSQGIGKATERQLAPTVAENVLSEKQTPEYYQKVLDTGGGQKPTQHPINVGDEFEVHGRIFEVVQVDGTHDRDYSKVVYDNGDEDDGILYELRKSIDDGIVTRV